MNRKTGPNSPVSRLVPLAVILTALLGLSSCGGGGGGGGGGSSGGGNTVITPPSNYYGAYETGNISGGCATGWGIGIATGYSSASAAATAAVNECRRTGGSGCDTQVGTFGSAYTNACIAIWSGKSDSACNIGWEHRTTLSAARTAALSECQGRYPTCEIEVSECSTSGPADSFYRITHQGSTGSGNTGGGNTGGNTGGGTSGRFYGGLDFSYRGSTCSDGYAVGVATGYSSASGANLAANRECSNAGGGSCGGYFEFGSAFPGNNECGAVAYGSSSTQSSNQCGIGLGRGSTRAAAESAAIATCRNNNGFSNCSSVTSACSISGPENSFARTGGGSTGGGNTGGNTGGNRPPVVRGSFRDTTIQQGETTRYQTSNVFHDPDGDRLNITARSNTSYVTAAVSGGQLVITGVQSIIGAATITVSATDPGGLTASTTFTVRVTAAPRQWGYYAVTGSNCQNGRRGWSLNSGYSDQASANSALRSVCNSAGGCPTGDTFRNQCAGVAVSDRCGYAVEFARSEASAQNAALAECRRRRGTNCRAEAICAGNP